MLKKHFETVTCALLASAGLATSSQAQTAASEARAPVLERLTACRSITSPDERLACFDRETATLDAAERSGDVVVVDRAQVSEARRALFGLSLPRFTLLDRGPAPEVIDRVSSTIKTARQVGQGAWLFDLEDGSTWLQVDREPLNSRARPGQTVEIRRGAIGTYFLSVNGARSLRVRRQQ